MPPVVRKDSVDLVKSPDGTGDKCLDETIQSTDLGSPNVFANSIGVVRAGDAMITHPGPNCVPHTPTCSTYSPNVYANFLNVMRLGDIYKIGGTGPDSPGIGLIPHEAITGSGNVFAN